MLFNIDDIARTYPEHLQQAIMKIYDNETCPLDDHWSKLCAGYPSGVGVCEVRPLLSTTFSSTRMEWCTTLVSHYSDVFEEQTIFESSVNLFCTYLLFFLSLVNVLVWYRLHTIHVSEYKDNSAFFQRQTKLCFHLHR